ncbi:MAG TPA: O-antigen ligase family protein [Alphaproteobacteria bacterium]|nr:O-antigen ligase family protein [Alphaproteobacteria bacterium]
MLGANRPVAWSGLALGLGILLIGWALTAGRTAGGAPLPFRSLAPAAIPFFLAIAWALAQALPYVPPQLHDSAWAEAGAALGMALPGRISLAPEEAGTGIMRLLSYGAVLLLAAQLGHSARRAHAILWGVALAGGAYALYGLLVWADGNRLILWMAKWAYPDSLTSSFVSRNHYATYAGLGLCASLGLLAHALARQPRAGAHTGAALIPLALMIAAALLLTRSRGGIASATLAVLVMTVLFAFGTEGRRTRMAFAAAALGLLAAGAGVLGGGVIARMAPEEVEDWGGRSDIWARAAAAALDRPLGGGLGAFADFFPAYRDLALGLQFGSLDKAHNLYLEMAAELGPTVAAALVLGLGWLVLRVIRGSLAANPGPALAAAGASVLVAVHSLADFSLQIPAVTATWLLLLGAALGQAQRAASLRATGRSRESAHKAPGDLPESPPRFASATDR